jgi:hypothetical protein
MPTKADIPQLVGRALRSFHTDKNNRPGDPLPVEKIASIIEDITGEKLYAGVSADIREEMLRRESAGQGVKRLSSSAHVWALETWFMPD